MNKIIKSIHEQLTPDERIVNDLLEQIKNGGAEEARVGGKRLWLALPAAVICVVVCVGIYMNLNREELPKDETPSAAESMDINYPNDTSKVNDTSKYPSGSMVSGAVTVGTDSQEESENGSDYETDNETGDESDIVTTVTAEWTDDLPDESAETSVTAISSDESENIVSQPEKTVNSAEYIVDTVYKTDEERTRQAIALVVSESYKRQIMEKADTITFDHKKYVCTGETLANDGGGKALGEGRLIVNGGDDTYHVWIYEAQSGSADFRIAVDIGDWNAIVYECYDNTITGGEVSSAECTLERFDDPDEVMRSTDIIFVEQNYKKKILEKLHSVTFDGREYVWSGEFIDDSQESTKWLGNGKLTVDGDMVFDVWVYEVKGVSESKEIALDIGDYKHCRFVCK